MRDGLARGVAIVGGLFLAGFGGWALSDPRAFYDAVALWPPYNHHFLHDIGAFQIGLGLVLLLAVAVRDALLVALTGVAVAQTVHALVHGIDRDLGGRSTDPLVMTLLAAFLAGGAVSRWRTLRRLENPAAGAGTTR